MALLLLLALLPLQGFPSAAGFSLTVAAQAGFVRWPSIGTTCRLQLATWSGCRAKGPFHLLALYGVDCGFSALAPPLGGVSPFLHQGLSLDVVCGVPFPPPCHIVSPCPSALLRSFRVSSPSRAVRPPSWALVVFLRHLPSSSFASLHCLLSARLSRWFSSLWP